MKRRREDVGVYGTLRASGGCAEGSTGLPGRQPDCDMVEGVTFIMAISHLEGPLCPRALPARAASHSDVCGVSSVPDPYVLRRGPQASSLGPKGLPSLGRSAQQMFVDQKKKRIFVIVVITQL